jgi:hypothetical protein
MIEQTNAYITSDNRMFRTEEEAKAHQHVLDIKHLIEEHVGDAYSRYSDKITIERWEEFRFLKELTK